MFALSDVGKRGCRRSDTILLLELVTWELFELLACTALEGTLCQWLHSPEHSFTAAAPIRIGVEEPDGALKSLRMKIATTETKSIMARCATKSASILVSSPLPLVAPPD